MNQEVLFQITRANLETGMRGFPVGYCPTSTVDPQKGIFYRGHPIETLVGLSPEQVIYLLLHKKIGSLEECTSYFSRLYPHAVLKEETIEAILKLPKRGSPMKLLSAALLIVGMLEGREDYLVDCEQLIMKAPHIVALIINHHAGWGKTPMPEPHLGYMESFAQMLNIPGESHPEFARALRLFNILHYDHGGGNLSTFVGKAVASGLEDMYGSMAAAICALAGPRHGKANQDCLEFLRGVIEEVGENATASQIEALIRHRLEKKELLFGFGHAVLRVEDPRATVIYKYLQKHHPTHPLVKIALLLRSEGTKVLKENRKIANPYPNVDAASGTLLAVCEFDYPEYFPLMFGLSRIVGIAPQIVYERTEAREGRGTPILRPKYIYNGPLGTA